MASYLTTDMWSKLSAAVQAFYLKNRSQAQMSRSLDTGPDATVLLPKGGLLKIKPNMIFMRYSGMIAH